LRKSLVILPLALLSMPSYATHVLGMSSSRSEIAVAQDIARPWQLNERACVLPRNAQPTCGTIIRATPKGAILRLEIPSTTVTLGDQVSHRGERSPAGISESTYEKKYGGTFNLSAGMAAGINYFFPLVHFQVALGPNFAIGLMPFYYRASAGTASLSALGGLMTLNAYFGPYYSGFWITGGAGLSKLSFEDPTLPAESKQLLTGQFAVGYRARWVKSTSAGIAVGAKYLADPQFAAIETKSSGVQPLIMLDFGFNF